MKSYKMCSNENCQWNNYDLESAPIQCFENDVCAKEVHSHKVQLTGLGSGYTYLCDTCYGVVKALLTPEKIPSC